MAEIIYGYLFLVPYIFFGYFGAFLGISYRSLDITELTTRFIIKFAILFGINGMIASFVGAFFHFIFGSVVRGDSIHKFKVIFCSGVSFFTGIAPTEPTIDIFESLIYYVTGGKINFDIKGEEEKDG